MLTDQPHTATPSQVGDYRLGGAGIERLRALALEEGRLDVEERMLIYFALEELDAKRSPARSTACGRRRR